MASPSQSLVLLIKLLGLLRTLFVKVIPLNLASQLPLLLLLLHHHLRHQVPATLRHAQRSRTLLVLALTVASTTLLVWWVTLFSASRGFEEPGWQASGQEQCWPTGWVPQIEPHQSRSDPESTWCCGLRDCLHLQCFHPPHLTGGVFDDCRIHPRSVTLSLPRRKRESTVQLLGWCSLRSNLRDGSGLRCDGFRKLGSCESGSSVLHTGVATGTYRRRQDRGSFNGDHETWRRFSPVFTLRLSASRSGAGREFRKCRCSGTISRSSSWCCSFGWRSRITSV